MPTHETSTGPTRAAGSRLEPEHVERLTHALHLAGLGGLAITEIHLAPAREGLVGDRACHAEPQPDGTWKIVCA
jgi:hypothetical protein